MARPKQFKDSVRVSLVLSKEHAERIKYMAIKMSVSTGKTITLSEAIRSVLEAAYPIPKQGKLFK